MREISSPSTGLKIFDHSFIENSTFFLSEGVTKFFGFLEMGTKRLALVLAFSADTVMNPPAKLMSGHSRRIISVERSPAKPPIASQMVCSPVDAVSN